MPNKEFLEEYSLFRKFKTKISPFLSYIPTPAINMPCEVCASIQTFNLINDIWEFDGFLDASSNGKKIRMLYECQSCKKFTRQFDIFISPDLDYCYKFGQYPEWEIKMDKNLEKTLGKHSNAFRKGLVCLSQGYGIGAFAYFRRITEEIIDELLDSISDLIEVEHKEKFSEALAATKKNKNYTGEN